MGDESSNPSMIVDGPRRHTGNILRLTYRRYVLKDSRNGSHAEDGIRAGRVRRQFQFRMATS